MIRTDERAAVRCFPPLWQDQMLSKEGIGQMHRRNGSHDPCYERRAVLGLVLTPLLVGAGWADDAASMPPQRGDHFVFLTGPKKGQVVRVDDLVLGGPQMQAYPA